METRYEKMMRLYKEASAAAGAANAAYSKGESREWRKMRDKSIEANKAYLDFIKENPPAPDWSLAQGTGGVAGG
jgi:hypothetical protein